MSTARSMTSEATPRVTRAKQTEAFAGPPTRRAETDGPIARDIQNENQSVGGFFKKLFGIGDSKNEDPR